MLTLITTGEKETGTETRDDEGEIRGIIESTKRRGRWSGMMGDERGQWRKNVEWKEG